MDTSNNQMDEISIDQIMEQLEQLSQQNEQLVNMSQELQNQINSNIAMQRNLQSQLRKMQMAGVKNRITEKMTNFKNGVVNRVNQAKTKVGNFKQNQIENLKGYERKIELAKQNMIEQIELLKQKREQRKIEKEADRLQEQERQERLEQRKEDFKAALREQDRKKLLAFKDGVVQKVSSAKSKAGRVMKEKVIEAIAKAGNLDLKFKNALLKGEIGLEEMRTNILEKYEAAKGQGNEFTQEVIGLFRKYMDTRRMKRADRLQEQERQEQLKQRKEDFKAALREQDRKKLLAFKDGVVQKVSSAKSKVGRVMKDKVIEAMAKAGNLDLKFKNALLRGSIEFESSKRDILAQYEQEKIRGVDFSKAVLDKFRKYKEQVRKYQAEIKQGIDDKKQEWEDERNQELGDRLQEQVHQEYLEQRKEDFKAALREQDREKLTAFKKDVVQKVSSVKGKAGKFAKGTIDKFVIKGKNLGSQAQGVLDKLAGIVKGKATQVKSTVSEKVDSYKEMLDELAHDHEIAKAKERERLQQEYDQLMAIYTELNGPDNENTLESQALGGKTL